MSNRARLGFGREFFFARSLSRSLLFSPCHQLLTHSLREHSTEGYLRTAAGADRGCGEPGEAPPPPHSLGSSTSHPCSAPALSTLGQRGVAAIAFPLWCPRCVFAGGQGDAHSPTPHTLRCFAQRFPRAARTRRCRSLPSGRGREAFSTRHLDLSQVATAQGREGETLGPGGGPRRLGSSA